MHNDNAEDTFSKRAHVPKFSNNVEMIVKRQVSFPRTIDTTEVTSPPESHPNTNPKSHTLPRRRRNFNRDPSILSSATKTLSSVEYLKRSTKTIAHYAATKKWQAALGELDRLVRERGNSVKPDTKLYNAVLGALARAGQWRHALGMVDEMKSISLVPDSYTHVSVLTSFAKVKNWRQADAYFQGISPEHKNLFVFNAFAHAMSNAGQWQRALDVLGNIKQAALKPDVYTFSTVISACVNAKRSDVAKELFSEMNSLGIKPNKVTLTSMIPIHANSGDWRKALQIYESLTASKSEDTKALAIIVGALVKGSKFDLAEDLIDTSHKNGMRVNDYVYGALMAGYGSRGKWREALELMFKMHSKRVLATNSIYIQLINACGNGPKPHPWHIALAGYDTIRPNHNIPILERELASSHAVTFLPPPPQMLPPMTKKESTVAANALLRVFAKEERLEEVTAVLEYLRTPRGGPPDHYSFSLAMGAFLRANRFHEALTVYNWAEMRGENNDIIKTAAITASGEIGNRNRAQEIYFSIENKDSLANKTMMSVYEKYGSWEDAIELIKETRDAPANLFSMAMRICCQAGKLREAIDVANRIEQAGLVLTEKMVATSVQALRAATASPEIVEKFTESVIPKQRLEN
eukprot:CAMPEP_0167749544 /NCGR_PEP_ID=MMETSP0110_2-20121227/5467_1 /TAXON_ID=629695 /ORGANISM="Gymnochlora sp., Strain CCMP2014" /LENGTH=635 /DNA_ID=CAMNT_0007634711 /DNA_START=335 /DNA_END=2242 /DNA_ORIENTATION=-